MCEEVIYLDMELKSKEESFRKLQLQIKNNSKSILVYKKLSPILMLLFVFNAFIMFYFSLLKTESNLQRLTAILLVLLFSALTIFHFAMVKKKNENRNLDTEIYKLLRL